MKKINLIIFVINLLLTNSHLFSQNHYNSRIEGFKKKVISLKLSSDQQQKLFNLVEKQQKSIEACNQAYSIQDSISPLTLSNGWGCTHKANTLFRKNLSEQVSIEQFALIFKETMQPKVAAETQLTYNNLTVNLDLNTNQKKDLSDLVSKEVKKQIVNYEYLHHDTKLANATNGLLISKAELLYFDKLTSFNLSQPVFVNSDPRLKGLVTRAEKANIPLQKINNIIRYYLEANITKKEINHDFELWRKKYVVYMNDNKYNHNTIDKEFRKKISELLTYSEFSALFQESLTNRIKRDQQRKWHTFKTENNFDDKFNSNFRTITDHYAKQEILTAEYYNYDSGKAYTEISNLKAEEQRAYDKAFYGFGIKKNVNAISDFDPRVPFFMIRAKKAGVEDNTIKELVKALKTRQDEIKLYNEEFKKWEEKYIVYFHDQENSAHGADKRLKKRLSELLTIEQFEKMFAVNLQSKINRQTRKRFSELRATYRNTLTTQQLSGLETLIKEQIKKEVILYEYHGYDHKLAMQKLRASQYKFEKKYKSILKSIVSSPVK